MKSDQASLTEYIGAFWRYLKTPKTLFDLQDRGKALALFVILIILLQYLVDLFIN